MAAETPQQPAGGAPAPEGGGDDAHPPKGKGGLSSFLPLIIAVVVMPIAAWLTITLKSKMDKKAATSETETEKDAGKSHVETKKESSGHGGESKEGKKGTGSSKTKERNIRLYVPLTREAVAYVAAKEAEAGKPQDVDKIVTMDTKGEMKDIAQADKIVVNIANTHGMRYAVARISFLSDDPEFLERLNEKREKLLDIASGTIGSKTLEEIETIGFKNLLKLDLKGQFENALGRSGILRDIIITDFVVQ